MSSMALSVSDDESSFAGGSSSLGGGIRGGKKIGQPSTYRNNLICNTSHVEGNTH